MHTIWLEPLHGNPAAPPVAGGYYTGRSHPVYGHITMNDHIYGRWPTKDRAVKLPAAEAVRVITQFRDKGVPCRAEPPITITY